MHDPYTLHTLENGLRIVIERMPGVRSAAAGFLVRTGARDEPAELAGVSHFLEHMMFKGTRRRRWQDITIDFDRMGSIYNAFTSEDRTIYYGWVRRGDIEKQIELLADMMRPALPPEEFDMERNVILEEIAMSKDQIEHLALDFLQEKIFAGNPLAWPILGYESTVRALTRDQMAAYWQQRYAPDNMVLIVAGDVDPQAVIGHAGRYCGDWQPSGTATCRTPPAIHDGVDVLRVDRFKQQFLVLSYPFVSARDPLAETAAAVAVILGGENSRVFWSIVQTGLSPRAGSYFMDLTDCGVLLLYGACPPEAAEKLFDAMRTEAKRMVREGVKEAEVERVKNRRRTSLAVESEAPYHRLTQLIDDMEYHGAPRTVTQMLAEVDAVSRGSIAACFERFTLDRPGHLASVGPRAWPTGA